MASRFRRRATLVLWVFAAAFAAALAGALLLQRRERDDVSSYVRQLNEAQESAAIRYRSISQAYAQLQVAPRGIAEQLPRLRRAAQSLTTIRSQIEGTDAPKPAAELRRRMTTFLRLQETLAYELVYVAEYIPELQSAERPIARANARLAKSLQNASNIEEQARPLARYARELRAVAETLAAVEPPALVAPGHAAYVTQLRRYARSSSALAGAVGSGEREAIAAAGAQLRRASATPSGTARAQKRVMEAYNRRIARLRSLRLAVEEERRRVDRELGS